MFTKRARQDELKLAKLLYKTTMTNIYPQTSFDTNYNNKRHYPFLKVIRLRHFFNADT